MLPRIEQVAESQGEPDCERCGPRGQAGEGEYGKQEPDCRESDENGAEAAVTIFLPGVGNGVKDDGEIDYVNPDDNIDHMLRFADRLGRWVSIQETTTGCCKRILCLAHYDPYRSARENANALATQVRTILEDLAKKPWVARIYLHLLGFSAGGVVAVNLASQLRDCTLDAPGRDWCNQPMATEVPLEIDIVTMATPFRVGLDVWLAGRFFDPPIITPIVEFFAWVWRKLGSPFSHDFAISIGENDYRDPVAPCLCPDGFLAFVSSRRVGDEEADEPAGEHDPTDDPRLTGWNPRADRLDQFIEGGYTHDEVPEKILTHRPINRPRAYALLPSCRCVRIPRRVVS